MSSSLGFLSWKAEGSGLGRRVRIRVVKDSLGVSAEGIEGSWARVLDGVDIGGVDGRCIRSGLRGGPLKGEISSVPVGLLVSVVLSVVFSVVLSVFLSPVTVSMPLLFSDGSLAVLVTIWAARFSWEVINETNDRSVLLLLCGESGLCIGVCERIDEDSTLVVDEMIPIASSWSTLRQPKIEVLAIK